MSTSRIVRAKRSTGTNRVKVEDLTLDTPELAAGRSHSIIGCLSETVAVGSFTDGGSTSGTYQMAGSLPAGAVVLGTKVLVPAGFAGDTSAVLIIGDGSDTDRYNTSTSDIFTTAAAGVQSGVPSGNKLVTTENRPTLTVTTAADFTACKSNASGIVTVNIYFLQTA